MCTVFIESLITAYLIPEMTDSERTFLHTTITDILPDLPEVTKHILEETLQSLGVETRDDFRFIEEADLLSALRPVQARKVLAALKLRCKSCFTIQNITSAHCNHKSSKKLEI